jgi:restriction system protein
MAIPDFQSIMLPLLRLAGDGADWLVAEARDRLAGEFGLTDEERDQLLPSGTQRTFANRLAWSVVYLKQAGLLESAGRARFRITRHGLSLLSSPPDRISIRFLSENYPGFAEFRTRSAKPRRAMDGSADRAGDDDETPEERLQSAEETLRKALETELLDRVKQVSPAFFEQTVLDLLTAMGYGGSAADAAAHLGRGGDEGVDGVINEDKLGLDVVYVQAKRYLDHTIGRPDIQAFAGSLEGQRARKGVFITTSQFSSEARSFVERIEKRIVLIDGKELARLMIDHGVGVIEVRHYSLLRLDETYFEEADA